MRIPEFLNEAPDISLNQANIVNISIKGKRDRLEGMYSAQKEYEGDLVYFGNLDLLVKGGTSLLIAGVAILSFNRLLQNKPKEAAIGAGLVIGGLRVLVTDNRIDTQKMIRKSVLKHITTLKRGVFTEIPQE